MHLSRCALFVLVVLSLKVIFLPVVVPQATPVNIFLQQILTDLGKGQQSADQNFLTTAESYKNNPLLIGLSISRFVVPRLTMNVQMAIQNEEPLLVELRTSQLKNYPPWALTNLNVTINSIQAKWKSINTTEGVQYQLEV